MSTAAWALASMVALAEGPSPSGSSTEATTAAAVDDARPAPFVQAGLGAGAIWRRSHGLLSVTGGPTFAIEAGAAWNSRRLLRLGVGGGLAQTGYRYEGGFQSANTELFATFRLGVGSARVWGYGLAGLGMSVVVDDGVVYDDIILDDRHVGPAVAAGLGVRGRVGGRVSLGFEATGTLAKLPPFASTARLCGLVVAELRFGP